VTGQIKGVEHAQTQDFHKDKTRRYQKTSAQLKDKTTTQKDDKEIFGFIVGEKYHGSQRYT